MRRAGWRMFALGVATAWAAILIVLAFRAENYAIGWPMLVVLSYLIGWAQRVERGIY